MHLRELLIERGEYYLAHAPGLAAADRYNGAVAASTSALGMLPSINNLSKGIRIGKATRALVLVALGDIGTGLLGTITAAVASSSEKADGASLFAVPSFSITYADTDDNKFLKGEIDLRAVKPTAPVAGDPDLNLYIRHNGTGVNVAIIVQLGDLEREPGADALTTSYPASLITN